MAADGHPGMMALSRVTPASAGLSRLLLLDRLNGSYENLDGGLTSEAMEDFTGGVTEMFDLTQSPQNLFNIMTKAVERESMMGCSVNVSRIHAS